MQVQTGKGSISAMVVIAIWSLSLAVDLPGLAVTPIEGSFRSIFPNVSCRRHPVHAFIHDE